MFEYESKLLKAVDGDTIDLRADLGFSVFTEQRIRLAGINAPELHSPNPDEVTAAEAAKQYLESLLGGALTVKTVKPPKSSKEKKEIYGRYLATVVTATGLDVCAEMVKAGHAIAYDGKGKRPAWPWKQLD